MNPVHFLPPAHTIAAQVAAALAEDLGPADVSAALITPATRLQARLITREAGLLCGQAWFNETLRQVDPQIEVHWYAHDGTELSAEQPLCELRGAARAILSAERTAMNFLQLLSGTATRARQYVAAVAGTGVTLLDTRKTLPGLRLAQKYATRCGGFDNHRLGLYDQFLIKENHIHAAGSIAQAVARAKALHPQLLIEVEVENMHELEQACSAGAQRVMLDNFSLEQMRDAAAHWGDKVELEASGNVTLEHLREVAATGVHYISVGAVTKHVKALDLSLRFVAEQD